jgi:hypothetical protein
MRSVLRHHVNLFSFAGEKETYFNLSHNQQVTFFVVFRAWYLPTATTGNFWHNAELWLSHNNYTRLVKVPF